MPPLPFPIRLSRSSSEKFTGGKEEEDGGGRGRGTAKEVSRLGRGRYRSGRRRWRLLPADG